jgi:hypothetical protein
MSRSYRKTPIIGVCGSDGMRAYKAYRAGQERARVRGKLAHGDYDGLEFELAPWDEWDCPRDGKEWWGDELPIREWRK